MGRGEGGRKAGLEGKWEQSRHGSGALCSSPSRSPGYDIELSPMKLSTCALDDTSSPHYHNWKYSTGSTPHLRDSTKRWQAYANRMGSIM